MGVILSIIASVLATSKDVVSKYLAKDLSGNISAFASFLFALPFYLILLSILWLLGWESFEIGQGFFTFVILRALSDTGAEGFKMHALRIGEISVVSALLSLYPIFVLLFSPMITGDVITGEIYLGVILSVIGSLVLVYKPGAPLPGKAIAFGLAGSAFFALNNCFDRLSVQTASATFSGFVMTLLSCLILAPLLKFEKNVGLSLKENLKALFTRGFFEVGFMVAKLSALQFITVAETSAILRITLIFNVIAGRAVFKEVSFIRKIIGACITTTGIVWVILGRV